jgi:uncharacterized protein (TIGR03437 family)
MGANATLARLPDTVIKSGQVDAAGNIYLAGSKGGDAYLSKLAADGSVRYAVTLGGGAADSISKIRVDTQGAVYVLGTTLSPDFPATPGSLQTAFTPPVGYGQAFVAKFDPQGKLIFATLFGGTAQVNIDNVGDLAVDAAGTVYVSGSAGAGFPSLPGASEQNGLFVAMIDPAGKHMTGLRFGVGGLLALDGTGNIYVAGASPSDITTTPGAFQSTAVPAVCGGGFLGIPCFHQFVAKLSGDLTKVLYTTYISGSSGAQPKSLAVDAQGNATIAGVTNSPDYPTTNDALEPKYVAAALPGAHTGGKVPFIIPPPQSGFITKLNANGTALAYSTYFSGTQQDSVTFADSSGQSIALSGSAGSADLPGLSEVPQQCLPSNFVTTLNVAGRSVSATRIVPGSAVAYDAASNTYIVWAGSDVLRFDPTVTSGPVACVLDSADLQPVTTVAPGELVSLFGAHLAAETAIPPGGFPTSLAGVNVKFNGTAAPILYVSPAQINVQAPYNVAGSPSSTVTLENSTGANDAKTLEVAAANPTVFLDTVTPLGSIDQCVINGTSYSHGPLALALNPDGTRNSCSNPAKEGTSVTVFVQGLGTTDSPQFTVKAMGVTGNGTVARVRPLGGTVSGVWEVQLQFLPNTTGAVYVSLALVMPDGSSVPARVGDFNVWYK